MSQPGSAATGRAQQIFGNEGDTASLDRCRGGGVERGREQRGIRGQRRSVERQHQDLGGDGAEGCGEFREQAVPDDDRTHPVGNGVAPVPEGGAPLMRPPEIEEPGVGARDDHAVFVEQRRRVAAPAATAAGIGHCHRVDRVQCRLRSGKGEPRKGIACVVEIPRAGRNHAGRRNPAFVRQRRGPERWGRLERQRPALPGASDSPHAPSCRTRRAREAPHHDGGPTSAHMARTPGAQTRRGRPGAVRRPTLLRRDRRAHASPRARVNAIRSRARSRVRSGSPARAARPSTDSSGTRRGSCR